MKTLIVTAALAAFFSSAHAVEPDKKMHFGVSFALGVAAANQWRDEPVKAWAIAQVPGLLKELSDIRGTGFSGADLAANALGAALGVATTHWLIHRSEGKTFIAYRTEF